ncbi:hypothetical protein GCM10027093_71280 [Paraburkholderia jirisanensis]
MRAGADRHARPERSNEQPDERPDEYPCKQPESRCDLTYGGGDEGNGTARERRAATGTLRGNRIRCGQPQAARRSAVGQGR